MLQNELIYMGYKNTIFVTFTGTLFALLFTLITAYPLSIGKLKGKGIILKIIFFTMLFEGGLIPKYLVVRSLGLIDSLWVLVILGSINVFNMLIMMKFLKGIPISLIESAKIDGYNDIAILFKIVVPLSGAMLSSIGLFYAVASWNSFLGAIIYISDRNKMVLQVVLRTLFMTDSLAEEAGVSTRISTPEHFRMATIIITLLPVLMIYPFIQKYFMKGVQLGSVKE
jgi:putative aldouronate transport system permease protein